MYKASWKCIMSLAPKQFSLCTEYVCCFASHHQGILGDITFKEITDKGNDLFLWNGFDWTHHLQCTVGISIILYFVLNPFEACSAYRILDFLVCVECFSFFWLWSTSARKNDVTITNYQMTLFFPMNVTLVIYAYSLDYVYAIIIYMYDVHDSYVFELWVEMVWILLVGILNFFNSVVTQLYFWPTL